MSKRKVVYSIDECADVLRMPADAVLTLIRQRLLWARDFAGHGRVSHVALVELCLIEGRPLGRLDGPRRFG